jgi:hypothetical protein
MVATWGTREPSKHTLAAKSRSKEALW